MRMRNSYSYFYVVNFRNCFGKSSQKNSFLNLIKNICHSNPMAIKCVSEELTRGIDFFGYGKLDESVNFWYPPASC